MFDKQVKMEIVNILAELKTINETLLKALLFEKFPLSKKPHINKNFYSYITDLEEKGYIKTQKEEFKDLRLTITNKGILLSKGEIVENEW